MEKKKKKREGVLLQIPLQLLVSPCRPVTGIPQSEALPATARERVNKMSCPVLKPSVAKRVFWEENKGSVSSSCVKNPMRKF